MTLDEYVETLSPTHTFYLNEIRDTAAHLGDPITNDFALLMEVDRRARIDMWFQERRDEPLDYCEPHKDYPDMYTVMLAESQVELHVKLEDDLVTRAGDPV